MTTEAIRTLIVDDDFRVAALHRDYVSGLDGFSVAGVAHTGADALAKAAALRPDLVLLDIYLPDMSGLEVLARLREDAGSGPDVLAITAARDVEVLRAAMRGGVVHYLIKPFRLPALEEKLRAYASARTRLVRLAVAEQTEVDGIFATLRPAPQAAASALPKGLSESTLELVLGSLRSARSGLTAQAVAKTVGLSRVTARRYLDHLCRLGLAQLSLRYGVPGRPEHRYRLTEPAHPLSKTANS